MIKRWPLLEWYPVYFLFCSMACTVFHIIWSNFAFAKFIFALEKAESSIAFWSLETSDSAKHECGSLIRSSMESFNGSPQDVSSDGYGQFTERTHLQETPMNKNWTSVWLFQLYFKFKVEAFLSEIKLFESSSTYIKFCNLLYMIWKNIILIYDILIIKRIY